MRSDTVITLSLRHWDRRDHARFWLSELGPALGAAAVGIVAAAAIVGVVGVDMPQAVATAIALATCAIALPTVVALEVSRKRAPLGFEVVRTEAPAAEYAAH